MSHGPFSFARPCPACGGSGKDPGRACTACGGTGAHEVTDTVDVSIPAGVDTGSRVRLKGKGQAGRMGGPQGDLYIETHILPDAVFTREGPNLKVKVPVTFPEATLGARVAYAAAVGRVNGPLAGLEALARQIRKTGIRRVGDVLIDDRLFPPARGTGSGPDRLTPIMVNDNVVDVLIEPGSGTGGGDTVCGETDWVAGGVSGAGGVRIEGAFAGDITVRGLIVVGETGRVTCENLKANTVIVAGTVNGSITAEKLDIRSTGRVWGDVIIVGLATEEGAFLRGQVKMEEKIDFQIEPEAEPTNLSEEAPKGDVVGE